MIPFDYMMHFSQYGNFKIFLSLRFYVKSLLVEIRSAKNAVFAIFGALNYVNLVDFSFQKAQKFMKIKVQSF